MMTDTTMRPADRAEITVLVDNYIDIFTPQTTPVERRLPFNPARPVLAEHGFSCLVRVSSGGTEHTLLLDAGLSADCMAWNARQMGIDLTTAESVVLSHGHFDHTGGLAGFFCSAGRRIPLTAHPDAFIRRRLNNPVHGLVELPPVDGAALEAAGADIRKVPGSSVAASGLVLVTGEVERKVPFETGMPGMEMYVGGEWVPDPIRDDQAVVISVKDKGLVVLSGCAHAGIANTVAYAREVTGIDRVHAILGGFHLTGPAVAPRIRPTMDAIARFSPDYVVPMHCTGWDAINRFMEAMPGKCILNTVGTTYVF